MVTITRTRPEDRLLGLFLAESAHLGWCAYGYGNTRAEARAACVKNAAQLARWWRASSIGPQPISSNPVRARSIAYCFIAAGKAIR